MNYLPYKDRLFIDDADDPDWQRIFPLNLLNEVFGQKKYDQMREGLQGYPKDLEATVLYILAPYLLRSKDWNIFFSRYVQGESPEEIAEKNRYTITFVNSVLRDIRKALRNYEYELVYGMRFQRKIPWTEVKPDAVHAP